MALVGRAQYRAPLILLMVWHNFNSTYVVVGNGGTILQSSPAQAFSQWAPQYFNAAQMTASSISGPAATPENDGIPNLLKYLYDVNPSGYMSAADRSALPIIGMSMEGDLTLTYRQNPLMTGITVNVQTSGDLKAWQTMTNPTLIQIGTDSTTGDPMMQVQVPVTGPTQFIRLNVTSP